MRNISILNSRLGWWLISKYCTAIQNGYQLIWKYFGQVPIANGNEKIKKSVLLLVDQILIIKKQNPSASIAALESEIDLLVYQQYELTEEEIRIVKNE